MNNDTTRAAMIDKVQKMLAMAESTTHEGEARVFKEKAAELMAKFQMDNADLLGKPQYIIRDEQEQNPDLSDQHISNAVAKFNGIFCLLTGTKGNNRLQLVGTIGDLTAYDYMLDSVYRQRNTGWCDYCDARTLEGKRLNERDREAWFLGFAYGLAAKVRGLLSARDKKVQEWGLVPVDGSQNSKNWYTQNVGDIRSAGKSKARYEYDGINAGKNATLNKGVQATRFTGLQLA